MLKAGVFVAAESEFAEENKETRLLWHEKIVSKKGMRVESVLFLPTDLKSLVWIPLLVKVRYLLLRCLSLVNELTFVVNGI